MTQHKSDAPTVVITGASSGIGAEAARVLATRGYQLALVGRSPERTGAIAHELGARAYLVDYESSASVRALAAKLHADLPVVDVLANNAGALFADRALTIDGHERTWQVNVLSPSLLTRLLMPLLLRADSSRVVFTASDAHKHARLDPDDLEGINGRYTMMGAYARAKLGTLRLASQFAGEVDSESVSVSSFHPGFTTSEAFRDRPVLRRMMHSRIGRAMSISAGEGARPLVHLAVDADPMEIHGAFFDRMAPSTQTHRQHADQSLDGAVRRATAEFADSTRP